LRRRAPTRRALSHEGRIFFYTIAAALPAVVCSLLVLWLGGYSAKVEWTVTVVVVGAWLGFALAARERVVRPLQTLSNLLAALREDDYSIRGRHHRVDDALGAAMAEVNALGASLRDQRLGAIEASTLLAKVLAAIDVAIFAFDEAGVLRLANRAGERLLARGGAAVVGQSAAALGLADLLEGGAPRTTALGDGRQWLLRRAEARLGGRPHTLVVLTDVQRALRDEEQLAWQRLVRVLGHEINNSLTPIQSIAGSLRVRLPADADDDVARGLAVIERRAEALGRFMGAYARLARLPRPKLAAVDVGAWVRRVAELEPRLPVTLAPGPDVTVAADGDQLDQLLINIVRNAADATLEAGGGRVTIGWTVAADAVDVVVDDEGPGISQTSNLFVPFFTTKPNGSGIGLVLSRQIAEAHGGRLELRNRSGARGCAAHVRLPR
jgi:nitrogen fixation/metabolism regulation signal transduction histidine kinase